MSLPLLPPAASMRSMSSSFLSSSLFHTLNFGFLCSSFFPHAFFAFSFLVLFALSPFLAFGFFVCCFSGLSRHLCSARFPFFICFLCLFPPPLPPVCFPPPPPAPSPLPPGTLGGGVLLGLWGGGWWGAGLVSFTMLLQRFFAGNEPWVCSLPPPSALPFCCLGCSPSHCCLLSLFPFTLPLFSSFFFTFTPTFPSTLRFHSFGLPPLRLDFGGVCGCLFII